MTEHAWPFLVARARTAGHQVVAQPEFLPTGSGRNLLARVSTGELDPPGRANLYPLDTPYGALVVVYRNYLATERDFGLGGERELLDRAGRPIVVTEGVVLRGKPREVYDAGVSERDLGVAHQHLVPDYVAFWRADQEQPISPTSAFGLGGARGAPDRLELRVHDAGPEPAQAARSRALDGPRDRSLARRRVAAGRPRAPGLAAPRTTRRPLLWIWVAVAALAVVAAVVAAVVVLGLPGAGPRACTPGPSAPPTQVQRTQSVPETGRDVPFSASPTGDC